MNLTIGQEVVCNFVDGFGGDGVVIAERDCPESRYQVAACGQKVWAHDFELSLPPDPKTRDDVIRSTARHIRRVGSLLAQCVSNLAHRAVNHDASKWSPEEWPAFEEATPKLAGLTYGSEEYKASLRAIKPAVEHHNKANRHHPEHHTTGIDGMTLIDLLEMLCDWKAAGERHHDGSIVKSLEHNRERFKISPQLMAVLENTAVELGWIQKGHP